MAKEKKKVKKDRGQVLSTKAGLGLLAPALVLIGIFLIFPLLWVVIISFTNRTLTGITAVHPSFVGLNNYFHLFNLAHWMRPGEFGNALVNTVWFVIGSAILGQVPLGLAIAMMFRNQRGVIREVIFSLASIAWVLPEVAVAFCWIAFLDEKFGTFNSILRGVGLPIVDWYFKYPLAAITLFNVWRGTAFSMLLFSAALGTIPPSYWETAAVVGASRWQRFRDIIFPLIMPHIFTDLILITLWTFNTFTPYLITGGGPLFHSETVPIYTYRVAFKFFEFGHGAAVAVIMMLLNLVLAIVYLISMRRQVTYK